MKRVTSFLLALVFSSFAYAGDEDVTVRVSVAGTVNSAQLRRECEVAGKKAAVEKYLKTQNSKMPEKVILSAKSSYAKFVDDIETDESDFEDGELTCSFTVTIKQEELAQWLGTQGVSAQEAPDGSKLEIVVMEEPPDAGQLQLGEDAANFFFSRYAMFQRRIRDALLKGVQKYNFDVMLLEDNESYESFKKHDPVLVGVNYNVDTKSFEITKGEDDDGKMTREFTRAVQENNPDTIVLYYRIDALAYDPSTGQIRISVALSFKNLASNITTAIGTRDFAMKSYNKKPDMLMADFGTCAERAMTSLLNGEGMGAKLTQIATKMRNEAARPKGPMKLVLNCSKVDKKIKIRVRNALKKSLIASGLTDETKVVKDSLTCTVKASKDFGDLDDVWGKVSEILPEILGDDAEITDDWAKKNGNTLTVTIGK